MGKTGITLGCIGRLTGQRSECHSTTSAARYKVSGSDYMVDVYCLRKMAYTKDSKWSQMGILQLLLAYSRSCVREIRDYYCQS